MVNLGLQLLAPPQRFMYEYGCFISFWGNFDLMMEALIGHLGNKDAVANCQEINKLTSGPKHDLLAQLLKDVAVEAVTALDRVFDIAERNDWVHGIVLNPRADFSVLTRFRVDNDPFTVENTPIDFSSSPFQEFYEAYRQFEQAVDCALGVSTIALCNEYLRAVQHGANV